MALDFRILGPLEVRADGAPIAVGGARQRALLAVLVVHANEIVSSDRLIDDVWGDRPPATATNTLQVHLSRLRRALAAADGGRSPLVRVRDGYRLELDPEQVDVHRFEQLVAQARTALAAGDHARAAAGLDSALRLWRGPPLADVADTPFVRVAGAELAELRLAALKDRIDADLALGRHGDVVGELRQLAREHPLDERIRAQLMTALYRSGRQAEALDEFRAARLALAELGLEPGEELRSLERRILRHEWSSGASPGRHASPGRRRSSRRRIALGSLVIALAAGLTTLALAQSGAEERGSALRAIDPLTNEVVASVELEEDPDDLVEAAGDLWVALPGDGSRSGRVARIDPRTLAIENTYVVSGIPEALASARDVWVAVPTAGRLVRIDPRSGQVEHVGLPHTGAPQAAGALWERWRGPCLRYRASSSRTDFWLEGTESTASLLATGDAVWLACTTAALERLDVHTRRLVAVPIESSPAALAATPLSIWVTSPGSERAVELDARTGVRLRSLPAPGRPRGIAVFVESVWIAACRRNAVWRYVFDEGKGRALGRTRIPVGAKPVDLAHLGSAVWVANRGDGSVSRIDLSTGRVVATIPVGGTPRGLAGAEGLVWVSVRTPGVRDTDCAAP